MSNEQTSSKGRKPTHRAYTVTGEGKKANWTPIGAAWTHQDEKGFNIQLAAMPLDGCVVMRIITERPSEDGGQQ